MDYINYLYTDLKPRNVLYFDCGPTENKYRLKVQLGDLGSAVSTPATGNSNDIDLDIGQTSSATSIDADIVGQSGSDSNVVAATVDGNSAILRITINGDTNNYLIDIDGNGDVVGHTLIHTHTGGIADVDITQSGVNDQMITLTTSGDNADIDISQTD